MFSGEDECVDLTPTLYPTANVEHWLLLVEGSMRNTVRTTLGNSLENINLKPRAEWVLEWPGQVVIAGSQTFWTAGVEKGIDEGSLKEFLEDVIFTNVLLHSPSQTKFLQISCSWTRCEVWSRGLCRSFIAKFSQL
jgi:hypothetical protein